MGVPEVVVVGAGALGAAAAFYLTEGGAKVKIVDHLGVGTQTTARAAGQCMHIHSSDELSRIGIRSIEMFEDFPEEVGRPIDYVVSGSLKLATSDDFKSQLQDEVDRGRRLGVDVSFVNRREAKELAPWLNPPEDCEIWFAPGDRYFEFPDSVPRAYVSAAIERGAQFVRARAKSIAADGSVTTDAGTLKGDVVVIAAGAWSRHLIPAEFPPLPAWPVRHQIMITHPVETVQRQQPSVRFIEAKTYTRPHLGGLMFGGYEEDPWSPLEPGEVADIAEVRSSEEVLRRVLDRLDGAIPALTEGPAAEVRAGLPTMSPDGHFVVDRAVDSTHIWVASGCNVAGFSTSPAIGRDLAAWILTGDRPADLGAFGLDRFSKSYDDATMRQAARHMYADKYSYDELKEH